MIRTVNDLYSACNSQTLNVDDGCPYSCCINQRILVIEEIDCSAWKDIIRSRTLEPVPQRDNDFPNFEVGEDGKVTVKPKLFRDDPFTLSDLLELLDGVIEVEGRVIIATTNHPELIDPALTRPGRFDVIVEFTNMSRKNASDMYHLWFDKKLPKDVYHGMKDYTFSQAEIGQLFSCGDFERIHSTLVSAA